MSILLKEIPNVTTQNCLKVFCILGHDFSYEELPKCCLLKLCVYFYNFILVELYSKLIDNKLLA